MPDILFFPYFGPNRHSDKRVVECRLDFSRDKESEFPRQVSDIQQLLIQNGILDSEEEFPQQETDKSRIDWYSSLFVRTALILQQKNSHQVDFFSISSELPKKRSIALVEYEDSETVLAAIQLAVEIFSGKSTSLNASYQRFSEFARERVLSAETKAIIRNARRRNIPLLQLDQAPLTGCINTGFRIRRNGLLCLGQGANSQILDGTFCVSRSDDYLKALLRNPDQRMALLKQLGIPVIRENIDDGPLLHLLVINGKITAISQTPGKTCQEVNTVDQSLNQQALSIGEKIGFTPIVVTYRVSDFTRPLKPSTDGVIGFELAPDLNKLLGTCSRANELLIAATGNLVEWLFPESASARIPVVAVTGTNGKTTTSRMVCHIFNHKGYKTGLVCTDGIFLDQKQVSNVDSSTFRGHARVLMNTLVNAAVLETHHRGIAVHGFAFQTCDVGICLNVTEEHLAEGEIESLEEMTGIKRALVERAAGVAILFADDANCVSMIEHMNSDRICLVSLHSNVKKLSVLGGDRAVSFCVLEAREGQQWIVLYHEKKRLPVMPVNDIPATFDGTARFNVSNAMHAIAASYYSGIDIRSIRFALSIFSAGQQFTPGRMNVFDRLPFNVIMDFAHNPDGFRKICEFADLQQVDGRKIIAFAGMAKRTDDINTKIAKTVAGRFDYYFCKDYEPSQPPKPKLVAPFMQKVLLEEGVPREATSVLTYGKDVIFKILDSCEPGDLLFLLAGHAEIKKVPAYIRAYTEQCVRTR